MRFGRFVPVAIAALASSQITLAILVGPVQMTAGKAALIASVVGALVSYLLSRWAWERKGRPDLLRETVPFWLVSFAVWGVLSLTSHYAGAFAKHEHMHHLEKIAVVNGAYLLANCVTFVSRFLIFHYVLFADRRKRAPARRRWRRRDARAPAERRSADGAGRRDQPAAAQALTRRGRSLQRALPQPADT